MIIIWSFPCRYPFCSSFLQATLTFHLRPFSFSQNTNKKHLFVSFSVGSAHKILFLFIWKCLYSRFLKDLFLSKGFWVSSFFQHLNFSWLHFPRDSMKNTDINLTVDFWRVICLPLTFKSPFLSVVLVFLLWNDQMWFSLCSQGYRICGWHLLIVVGILRHYLFKYYFGAIFFLLSFWNDRHKLDLLTVIYDSCPVF